MAPMLEALWTPAALAIFALGCALLVTGVRRRLREHVNPPASGNANALGLVRSFRRFLTGGALIGIGVGLLGGMEWLVVLSAIIGGQELLETSIMAAALRDEERRRAAEAARGAAA